MALRAKAESDLARSAMLFFSVDSVALPFSVCSVLFSACWLAGLPARRLAAREGERNIVWLFPVS